MRSAPFIVVLLAGCVGGDPGDTPKGDTDVAADSDVARDTDRARDTDDTDVTTLPDTDVPERAPPASWGDGLVDVGQAALGQAGVSVFVGDPSTHQAPQTARALFTDLDGDGNVEVLVDQSLYATGPVTRAVHVFRYDRAAGELVRDTALEGALSGGENQAFLGGVDLDGDGREELLQESPDLIWWPDGQGGFTRGVTLLNSDLPSRWTYTTMSVLDVDEDGWTDLLVGSDGCAWSLRALLQVAPRTFEVRGDLFEDPAHMRLVRAATLWRGNGDVGVLASASVCPGESQPPGGYLVHAPDRGADDRVRWMDVDLSPANALWKLDPSTAGVPYTAAMPMGGMAADLDGDLLPDLILSLGSTYLAVLRALPDGGYADASTLRFVETYGQSDTPWGVVTPDLDLDGVADLMLGFGDDATSFFGYAGKLFPPRAYWGRGDFTFEDVTTPIGIQAQGNWHGLTMDDLDGDADPDIAVMGYGNAPLLLRNDIDVGRHALALRLRGTTSNPLGLGALVEVEADGIPSRAELMGGDANMDTLPRERLFFGLGDNTTARVVRVRWPSGVVQEVHDVLGDQTVELTEPASVTLSEVDRHVPANGSATVDVTVWPRDGVGAVRAASTVTLQLGGSPVVLVAGPMLQVDGSWRATLRAPSLPGSTRVVAVVDGVPYKVAPRVWWD